MKDKEQRLQELEMLLQRLAAGDPQALEDLYRLYFHRLIYLGLQIAGKQQRELIEDVVQEFFIWLAQNNPKIREVQDFEAYIFQSVRRNIQARMSRKLRSKASFERYRHRSGVLDETDSASPEQDTIKKEEETLQQRKLKDALDELPVHQREVLYLRFFEDKSYQEIAKIQDIGPQVVYNYVSNALKRLKKKLLKTGLLMSLLLGTIYVMGWVS